MAAKSGQPMAKPNTKRTSFSGWATPMGVQPTVRGDPVGGPVHPPYPTSVPDPIGLLPGSKKGVRGSRHDG